jgi:site-specific DNA-methyltransferase (adenine-specific)
MELIAMVRKPIDKSCNIVANNVVKYGTGAINIDACRIPTSDLISWSSGKVVFNSEHRCTPKGAITFIKRDAGLGRWPANFIHDGSEDVLELFPTSKKKDNTGSASRYFYCAKVGKGDRDYGYEEKKEGKDAHNFHPTVKPLKLMRYLCKLVTPPNGIVLDPYMGSGSTGVAAILEGFKFVGIEVNKEYYDIATNRINGVCK